MTSHCGICGSAFEHRGTAKYCPTCRPAMRKPKRAKYPITDTVRRLLESEYDSTIRGRTAEIARKLGWPKWAVKRRAAELGLSRPRSADRRAWTDKEVSFLRQWQGLRSARWISRQLGRGETSVALKFKRLGLSRRVRDGYTGRDFARCMGVDDKTVLRWIERGWLTAVKRGTAHPLDPWVIEERAIAAFLRDHRQEYDLRKVDQEWFLDFLFDRADTAGAAVPRGQVQQPEYLPTPAEIAARARDCRRQRELAGRKANKR